jgi:hypothetical protein
VQELYRGRLSARDNKSYLYRLRSLLLLTEPVAAASLLVLWPLPPPHTPLRPFSPPFSSHHISIQLFGNERGKMMFHLARDPANPIVRAIPFNRCTSSGFELHNPDIPLYVGIHPSSWPFSLSLSLSLSPSCSLSVCVCVYRGQSSTASPSLSTGSSN